MVTGLEKVSFHSNPKECSDYCTIAIISHASKVMLKILQARFQQYVKWEFSDVKAKFRKGRGPRDKIVNTHWMIEKRICFCFVDYPKAFDCVDGWQQTEKFLKSWEYQTTLPASWEIFMHAGQEATVRTGHGTTDCFQTGKGVHQGRYCHPVYLIYMQSTSCEMLSWKKHELDSRFPGEISITSDMQMAPP